MTLKLEVGKSAFFVKRVGVPKDSIPTKNESVLRNLLSWLKKNSAQDKKTNREIIIKIVLKVQR